jgi:hypothetical protein
VLIHLLITIFSFAPNVQAVAAYEYLSEEDKKIYQFVKNTCHLNLQSYAALTESTKEDAFDYFSILFYEPGPIPTKENLFSRKGVGKNAHRLLNSLGYYFALRDCFPQSENKRHLYTVNLLLMDAYGKAASISVLAVAGSSIYKGLALLGRKVAIAPTVKIFKKLNAPKNLLDKIPIYMGRGGTYAFNVGSLAFIGYYAYQAQKEKELTEEIYTDEDPAELRKALARNLNLYIRTKELRAKAPSNGEQIEIDRILKEQQEIVIYYVDSLLEQKISPKEKEELIRLRAYLVADSEDKID